MAPVDVALLAGRPPKAVVVPTAASLEGDARVAYWIELAHAHYQAMGIESVPLDVRTRTQADDPAVAAQVAGAGIVYLSGGDPHHLSDTLRASALWSAIVAAWRSGTALAGCSAGAMALTAGAPPELLDWRRQGRAPQPQAPGVGANGLGLVPGVAVIPHFDQMERLRPGSLEWFGAWQPPGTVLIGIEERTALVGDGDRWRVAGAGQVWIIDGTGRRAASAGETLDLPPPR
jgi:cyanophycinase